MNRLGAGFVMFLAAAALPRIAMAKQPITVGINKAVGAAEAERAGELLPIVLGKSLGRPVIVAVVSDYESLVAALLLGKIDLAWMSPLAYVNARGAEKGLVPVAKALRHGALYYRSVLVVPPTDTTTKTISDLQGKRIAWVSKGSTSGYLFPRALLKRQGIDADTFFGEQTFAGSHDAVCTAVLSGRVDVAATFADEPEEGAALKPDGCGPISDADKLRVVYKTGPISNDVLVARPGLKADVVKELAAALLGLTGSDAGKKVLAEVFRADGLGVAEEKDFDAVEQAAKTIESAGADAR